MRRYGQSGPILFAALVGATLLMAGLAQAQDWNNGNRDRWQDRDNWQDQDNDWREDRDRRNDYRDDRRNEQRDDRGDSGRDDNSDVTEAQKNACKPDVFRLCSWFIPNRDKITACLHDNIDKLNPNCRAVMEGRLR